MLHSKETKHAEVKTLLYLERGTQATSVSGLKLLVDETLSYWWMRP